MTTDERWAGQKAASTDKTWVAKTDTSMAEHSADEMVDLMVASKAVMSAAQTDAS